MHDDIERLTLELSSSTIVEMEGTSVSDDSKKSLGSCDKLKADCKLTIVNLTHYENNETIKKN